MRFHWRKLAVALALCGSPAAADEVKQTSGFRRPSPPPADCPAPLRLAPDGTPLSPVAPGTPIAPGAAAPSTDAFAQAGEGGTLPAATFAPAFFGDLIGINSTRFDPTINRGGGVVRTPSAARNSGWKIADDESPRPTDRVYYNFNFYNDANRAVNGNTGGTAFNVFRHVIGVEKTFLCERASIGLRLPFVDVEGPPNLSDRRFGDMSVVLKYALVNEPYRVLSGGMVVTVPTGGGIQTDLPNARGVIDGTITDRLHPVILQPYVGYWRHLTDRIYFQTFNSIAIPTDSRDVVVMSNDGAFGLWLYRNPCDNFIQSVVSTIEIHGNTPLTDRMARKVPIGFADQLNLTAGSYVVLPRSVLGVAVGVPLVAPRPYDIELLVNYTLRF